MQYIRKNGMIDINDAIEKGLIVYDEAELHGARPNKFWFNNYNWMYKDVDNEYKTYEEYAELICYELSKLLNINCAEYDLATYNDRKGVITRSVVKSNEKMIAGTEILNNVYEEYFVPKMLLYNKFIELINSFNIISFNDYLNLSLDDQKNFSKKLTNLYNQTCLDINDFITYNESTNIKPLFDYCCEIKDTFPENFVEMKNGIIMSNNLYDIWSAVEIYCKLSGYKINIEKFMDDLINMFIFDIITNQGDRHADNWSIIIDKDSYDVKLSALYDNSGALALNREKALVNIDDFSKRLKVETKPGKSKGIYRQLKQTIEHSFSGLKVTEEDVRDKTKNDKLIDKFVEQSSAEFINKLQNSIDLLSENNIIKIFSNIEEKTQTPIPNIVKSVVVEVLNHNINRIKERINVMDGDNKCL